MSALVTQARSRRFIRLGLPLAALVAIVAALLVPSLGAARSQSDPQNTSEPTISGSTAVGDTLTADPGSWSPTPAYYKFNFRRCPPDGGQGSGNCEGVTDGSSNTYTLQSGDVGFTFRVQVKAFASDGTHGTPATSNATGQITGQGTGPTSTGAPTVTGTASVGSTLSTDNGSWQSKYLVDFSYAWLRCDASGNNCAATGGTASTYVVQAADQGSTLRSQVIATNPAGTTKVNSAQTAVVPGGKPASPPPPPPPPTSSPPPTAAGCPAGKRPVSAASVTSPARLIVDRQLAQPIPAGSGQQVTVRYRVSDTCGQAVQGALVYAAAIPFGQLSTPAEAPTGSNGFVTLTFTTTSGFPLGPKQRSVQIFVRARKSGEDLLAGISARRLFEIPISR